MLYHTLWPLRKPKHAIVGVKLCINPMTADMVRWVPFHVPPNICPRVLVSVWSVGWKGLGVHVNAVEVGELVS